MEFSREEYWSGLSCPPPGDLLNPGVEPMSLVSTARAAGFFTISAAWEALWINCQIVNVLSSARRVVSVAISPSCPWNVKVATDDVEANDVL